ncbi:shikimate kinase [Thermococcus prieurii]
MRSYGRAGSAVTVVNAFATGKGAAVGIDLWTEARVRLTDGGISGSITVRGESYGDTRLVEAVVDVVRRETGEDFGIEFEISSEIPVGKGLKSSSAAANALVLALCDALGIEIEPVEAVRLGVKAARLAGVTITGAFDDASASLLGGLCLTDNVRDELIKREEVESEPLVLLIPEETLMTADLSGLDFSSIAPYIGEAFEMAARGEWRRALVINGLVYSAFLGHPTEPIGTALRLGAVAGLSGKGPAFFALTDEPEALSEEWGQFGRVEITSLR